MKFNRKTHITERQLMDLSGFPLEALRVRAKTDPKFPDMLFVNEASQMVYGKAEALEWLEWLPEPQDEKLEIVPPRQARPLAQQGEYKPSLAMRINMGRTDEVYPHPLATPKGIGNGTERKHGYGRGGPC